MGGARELARLSRHDAAIDASRAARRGHDRRELISGAALFGWLADLFGRKRLFFVTLGVYIAGTGASAFATDFGAFALFQVRALAIAFFYALGTAIGGIGAPWLFGVLIGTGEPAAIAWG